MKLEILEGTDNYWQHINQSANSRINLVDIASKIDLFSDLNFAGIYNKILMNIISYYLLNISEKVKN